MRVAVLPGDNGGCGTYRMTEVAAAVRAVRPAWSIRTYAPKGELLVHWHAQKGVIEVDIDPLPDVIVMQRTGTAVLAGVAAWLQARGVAVVMDMDDAMWTIDKANVAWAAWNNPHRHRGQHWSWCDRVAETADLVTVTTEHLARRYGRHGRVEVLPNRIPDAWVVPQDTAPIGTGGWAGYLATHPGDAAVAAPAAQVFTDLRVMGEEPTRIGREWGTAAVTGIPAAPLGPEYFKGLSRLGTMLVGLRQSSFNRAKSTLKVLEAAAAGVPSIAAATPPHVSLQREGFPVLLASTPDEWKQHAVRLQHRIEHEDMRAQVRAAMPGYVMSAQAEQWALAWERAAARSGFRRTA